MVVTARFDDLLAGTALALADPVDVLVAHNPADAPAVIASVEDAARAGLHAAGFVAYDAAPGFDPGLAVVTPDPEHHVPSAWFALFDHADEVPPLHARTERQAPYTVSAWVPTTDRQEFDAAIAGIRRHIADGDTYQVNYTLRLHAAFAGRPEELYRDLALAQRGAYSTYLDTGRHVVASATPELFFSWDGSRLVTRPMKGTAPRGRWPDEDLAAAERLSVSPKDRAENLMIVDLLRNDLGRIARVGSVVVEDLYSVERFETVWQMTSTIAATTAEGTSLVDVFRALFPCGSVTGAPKQRTMEIITDLEDGPRGVYCGAVGRVSPGAGGGLDARFGVAIRTVTVDRDEGVAEYGVGGGITWDSSASAEYDEARAKAMVLVSRRPEFSLLETLRYQPGDGFAWLDRHLDRLDDSAEYFGFTCKRDEVMAALDRAVAGVDSGVHRVRLAVDRGGDIRVDVGPLTTDELAPIPIVVDPEPVSSQDVFLFHKTTRRRPYELRRRRWPAAGDVILVNERGEVTESTIANVIARIDGSWVTPPLESGCLPGIYRQVLLDEGNLAERVLMPEDLVAAEEVALINSVRLRRRAAIVDPSTG